MTSESILLYDLPSKGRCACWSLNPWKTRISLNFKGVPYTTEWLEYPEIAPKLKSLGLPPNACPPATAEYSIPTARFDTNTIIMDSKKIAEELEKRHPSPSLHLDSPFVHQIEEILPQFLAPLAPILIPNVARNLLNSASFDYFQETRKKRYGMSLDELEKQKGGEHVWEDAKPGFEQASKLLQENNGSFFMGNTPSYADFIFVTALKFMQRIDKQFYERAVGHDPAFKKLFEACEKWMLRDDS